MNEQRELPPVSLHGVVRLEYEGQPWTAKRMKESNHIQFRNDANHNDGMTWAVPDQTVSELAWRIYHTSYTPTRGELFGILSCIDSYRELLCATSKRQRAVASVLAKFLQPNPESTGRTPRNAP